jgi:hypothetical protein
MTLYKLFFLLFALASCSLISCSSKSVSKTEEKNESKKVVLITPKMFTYSISLEAPASIKHPHDGFWIDTSGQMTFETDQHMKNGSWKKPRGLAYLEPKDEDSLLTFIRKDAFFSIEESDVSPQCPNGDQYILQLYRSDLNKKITLHTNTCASDFNLLTGEMRKVFPQFLAFIGRLRDRYRPLFTD